MLPKVNRVNKKGVDLLFKEGRIINFPSLTFRFKKNSGNKNLQISFIASKSIAKLAVKRNFLRRLGYRAFQKHQADFPAGIMGVFVFRKLEKNIAVIENEIKNLLNKIN